MGSNIYAFEIKINVQGFSIVHKSSLVGLSIEEELPRQAGMGSISMLAAVQVLMVGHLTCRLCHFIVEVNGECRMKQ